MTPLDRRMMMLAARAAWRGFGRVEPNPMVGCVIGDELGEGHVRAIGHHQKFGGPHAEVEALNACRGKGIDPRGLTAWVTLEPCSHHGKTPPCTEALLKAGIGRVVFAAHDPNPPASGGADWLRAAGIRVDRLEGFAGADRLIGPFVKGLTRQIPWVIAKWAQTIDGRIATRTGESQWISGEASRRMVHRLRARVDVVLTGIGTVLKDNPRLTARGVKLRRVARRAVVDPRLQLPVDSHLLETLTEAPLTVFTTARAVQENAEKAATLGKRGVQIIVGESVPNGRLNLEAALRHLADIHHAHNVLVECGPGLMGSLVDAGLVDELLVLVGPKLLGDPEGHGPAACTGPWTLANAPNFSLLRAKPLGPDAMLTFRAV